MTRKGCEGYFTAYLTTIQELPCLLQKFFTSLLDSDIGQVGPINSIASGLLRLSENKDDTNVENLSSMVLDVMKSYDAKLSEMTELLESVEKMLDLLSQSKSSLYANDEQQLKSLINAFTPKENVRRHASIPPQNPSPPPLPPQQSLKSVRRAIRQHHRPSSSQLTKWMSARRNATSSGRGGVYRGVKNRVPPSVRPSRSRIADLSRRNQIILDRELGSRAINASRSPTSSASSSDSEECQQRRSRSRSNSTPHSRKRDLVGKRSTADGSGEHIYCLCQKFSYGDMIACDNTKCEIEWFHFACVDVKVRPKGQWYCPRCRGESSKVKRPDA